MGGNPASENPTGDGDQREVISFLSDPETYSIGAETLGGVERIETHGAYVFLVGGDVYKIKRAVSFPYMDFSTLERRRRACTRELEINRPHAPRIYFDVIAITREHNGLLALGGGGTAVEWAVHMRRFPADALMGAIVAAGGLSAPMVKDVAQVVADYHRQATVVHCDDASGRLLRIIYGIFEALTAAGGSIPDRQLAALRDASIAALNEAGGILDRRGSSGSVRRVHGDLHLGNVVFIDGHPVLFDAIEFSDDIATIDLLYDLAFLVMDLDVAGCRPHANLLLNRYLFHSRNSGDIEALAAMPLFMAMRALVRAMVRLQRAAQVDGGRGGNATEADSGTQAYIDAAMAYLKPATPVLIAVGGLSGTGKSTLAASLAPELGRAPGALHLRSDLERKAMSGISETARLPPAAYTKAASGEVYGIIYDKARRALAAGQSVVADAVFSTQVERQRIEAVAKALGLPFAGLWLEASADIMKRRVRERRGDASDASDEVVAGQLARGVGQVDWPRIDAGAGAGETLQRAQQALSTALG